MLSNLFSLGRSKDCLFPFYKTNLEQGTEAERKKGRRVRRPFHLFYYLPGYVTTHPTSYLERRLRPSNPASSNKKIILTTSPPSFSTN